MNFLLVPADLSKSNYCNWSPLQSIEADKERLAKLEVDFAVGVDRGFGNHHGVVIVGVGFIVVVLDLLLCFLLLLAVVVMMMLLQSVQSSSWQSCSHM